MIVSAPTVEKILQAVNEKYSTSLEGWSQLPTAYEVGDTVPNWNAYEKIELELIAINTPQPNAHNYQFGSVKGSTYEVQVNGNNVIIASPEGVILTTQGTPLEGQYLDFVKQKMAENGYPITSVVPIQSTLGVGDSVENWNSYSIINV